MSHPEFLRSPSNIFLRGLQGAVPLAWGMGLCPIPLFSCAASGGAKGKKRYFGDTPIPDRGQLPSALPLLKRQYEHFRFQENSG